MLTMIKIRPITVVLICFVILQSNAQEVNIETKIKQVKETVLALLAVKKWDSVSFKPLFESTQEMTTNLNEQRNIILARFSKLFATPTNSLQEEKQ